MATTKTFNLDKELDKRFRQFVDCIKTSESYHNEGLALLHTVEHILKQNLKYEGVTVASTTYAGSVGKGTDVGEPDFDVVMKIAHLQPPFHRVLQTIEHILKAHATYLKIDTKSIHKTQFSVKFFFQNGIKVDLLPAVNDVCQEQALEKIMESTKNLRLFSSTLVDSQLDFMKWQSALCHDVARLGKWWYKNMDFGGAYISGGSTIFELLAVAAVLKEKEENGRDSIFAVFVRLVDLVANFDKLKLGFEKGLCLVDGSGGWRLETKEVQGRRAPYIMEPANPLNNLLHGMQSQVITVFKENGRVMQERLKEFREQFHVRQNHSMKQIELDFKSLFASVKASAIQLDRRQRIWY